MRQIDISHPSAVTVPGRPRVAIIEHDALIGPMISEILRSEGFDTTVIPEGGRALQSLRFNSYDAVILDIVRPGVDGLSILREIRGRDDLAGLPVIILTAKTDDSATLDWRAGADHFMTKPFDPDELVRVLRSVLPVRV